MFIEWKYKMHVKLDNQSNSNRNRHRELRLGNGSLLSVYRLKCKLDSTILLIKESNSKIIDFEI